MISDLNRRTTNYDILETIWNPVMREHLNRFMHLYIQNYGPHGSDNKLLIHAHFDWIVYENWFDVVHLCTQGNRAAHWVRLCLSLDLLSISIENIREIFI